MNYNYGRKGGDADLPPAPPPPRLSNSQAWRGAATASGSSTLGREVDHPRSIFTTQSLLPPRAAGNVSSSSRQDEFAASSRQIGGGGGGVGWPEPSPSYQERGGGVRDRYGAIRPETSVESALSDLDDIFRPKTRTPIISRSAAQYADSFGTSQTSHTTSSSRGESYQSYLSTTDYERKSTEGSVYDMPVAKRSVGFELPDKVYACRCIVVCFVSGCGVVELIGTGDQKAYCFFRSDVVLSNSTEPLSYQLKRGTEMMVHASLVDKFFRIPYCASTLWVKTTETSKGIEECYIAASDDLQYFYIKKRREIEEMLQRALANPFQEVEDRRLVGEKRPVPTGGGGGGLDKDLRGRTAVALPPPVSAQKASKEQPILADFARERSEAARELELQKVEEERKRVEKEVEREKEIKKKRTIEINLLNRVRRNAAESVAAARPYSPMHPSSPSPEPLAPALPVVPNLSLAPPTSIFTPTSTPAVPVIAHNNQPLTQVGIPYPPPFSHAPPSAVVAPPMQGAYGSFDYYSQPNYSLVSQPPPLHYPTQPLPPPHPSVAYQGRNTQGQALLNTEFDGVGRERQSSSSRESRQTKSKSRPRSPTPPPRSSRLYSPDRSRGHYRSRSRERHTRHRSKDRSRRTRSRDRNPQPRTRDRSPRQRSRERSRRSRSKERHRPSTRNGSKSPESSSRRSKSRTRKRKTRSRSSSQKIDEILGRVPIDPNIPNFLWHPKEKSGNSRALSVRKVMEEKKKKKVYTSVNISEIPRNNSLKLIKELCTVQGGEKNNNEYIFVSVETELLDDKEFLQFTQLGAALTNTLKVGEPEKQVTFFRSIIPVYMEDYNKNLILKNQNNLLSSLGMKYDENLKKYFFVHKNKKSDIEPVSEDQALKDWLAFLGTYSCAKKCCLVMHNKDTYLALLLAKLKIYNLYEDFLKLVVGVCDYTSLSKNLQLNMICQEAKFADMLDFHKQVMGLSWPKDVIHKDGVASVSDNCLKVIIKQVRKYLSNEKLELNMSKLGLLFGFQFGAALDTDTLLMDRVSFLKNRKCNLGECRDQAKSVELMPSDRPEETTIVELLRFECIEVDDLDEVEEEGIQEEDYFEKESLKAQSVSQLIIKPGFVEKCTLLINNYSRGQDRGFSVLVQKNNEFGTKEYCDKVDPSANEEKEALVSRLKTASQCSISRQIVNVLRSTKPLTDMGTADVFVAEVKVLNPSDVDIEIHKGDILALVKMEKEPQENTNRRSYSKMKVKAEKVLSTEGDSERNGESSPKAKTSKKQQKDNSSAGMSYNLDDLDFEPENGQDSDKSSSDTELEDETDLDRPNGDCVGEKVVTDVSEKDLSPPGDFVKDISCTRTITRIPETISQDVDIVELDDDDDDDVHEKDSNDLYQNLPDVPERAEIENDFYGIDFRVTLNFQIGNHTLTLPPGSRQNCSFIIKPEQGYVGHHMIGRHCDVSVNNKIMEKGCSILPQILKVFECPTSGLPKINACLVNNSSENKDFADGLTIGQAQFVVNEVVEDEPQPPGEDRVDQVSTSQLKKIVENISIVLPQWKEGNTIEDSENSYVTNALSRMSTCLTAKDLKILLSMNNLSLYGDKSKLSERTVEFYRSYPQKIKEIPQNVLSKITDVTVTEDQDKNDGILENSVAAESTHFVPSRPNLKQIIISDSNNDTAVVSRKISPEIKEKIDEIKSLSEKGYKFHDTAHDIEMESFTVEKPGYQIVSVPMKNLAVFFNDLLSRHVRVETCKAGKVIIKTQISKISLEDKMPTISIVLFTGSVDVSALVLKINIQLCPLDTENMFFSPRNSFLPAKTGELFDLANPVMATTTNDLVLLPKSFHTETCTVQLKHDEVDSYNNTTVIIERTSDHGMNIGMRKMILIPKVFADLSVQSCPASSGPTNTATVVVSVFNASKQRLRLSKKTNIAKVYLCRHLGLFNHPAVRTAGKLVHQASLPANKETTVYCQLGERVVPGTPVLLTPAAAAADDDDSGEEREAAWAKCAEVVPSLAYGFNQNGTSFVDVRLVNTSLKDVTIPRGTVLVSVKLGNVSPQEK